MTVGFDLQNQLDEIAQLQRLPEGFRRLVGDNIAVFGYRQQLVAAGFAALRRGHAARQPGIALTVVADRFQHDINGFKELLAVQIFQHCQVNARTALGDFRPHAVEAFFQQQRIVNRKVSVAGGHIAFGFDNAGRQQRFLLVGKHAVAAILYGLTAPPRAHFVEHAFVLFANGKPGAGAIGEVVDLFFDPANGVFREDRRRANFAGLVADDQFIVLNPDRAFRQVMSQRQRAAYRDRLIQVLLIGFGIVQGALGTNRRLNDMHQRHFMRLNARAQSVQFQRCHKVILVESPLNLCSEHSAARRRAARVQQAVYPERYRAD